MSGAARVNDPIEHSQAYFGFIAGAIVGAIAGVAVTVLTDGAGAGVGLGVYAATASFGEWLGSFPCFNHVTGKIQTGSPNVFINGLPAAVATDSSKQLASKDHCDSHPGPQFIAEGSTTVFINGRPASRIGDHTTCGAKISSGSTNVFIGGGTVSTVDIESEVPVWGHLSIAVSGIASCILLRIPVSNIASGALLGTIAGSAGRWIGGKLAGEGSNTQHLLEGTFGLLGAAYGGTSAEQRAMAFARFKSALAGGEAKNPAEIAIGEPTKSGQEKLTTSIESLDKNEKQNRRTYLNNKFGRTGNIQKDIYIRGNRDLVHNFMLRSGISEDLSYSYMEGIDLTNRVSIETINSSKKMYQTQAAGDAWQGNWYSANKSTPPTKLGINPKGNPKGGNLPQHIILDKETYTYTSTEKIPMLRSIATPALDTWSVKGHPFQTEGGGIQWFSTNKTFWIKP